MKKYIFLLMMTAALIISASSSATAQAPVDLRLFSVLSSPATSGDIQFQIYVSKDKFSDATDVSMTVPLPAGVAVTLV